nr:alpha/beta hydrolase [uncultured Celeribacter sp.]
MKRLCVHLVLVVCLSFPAVLHAAPERGCVILLHGLARTEASMGFMGRALERAGYQVVNQSYPSRDAPVEILAELALREARDRCGVPAPHVVTHSMGAILLRSFVQMHPELDWGRVVMLGPPNHGSEIIDTFDDRAAFVALNGPAGMQLRREDGLPGRLPPVSFEAGVIAGNQSLNPLLSSVLPGQDDGKVSVDSTYVEGMQAHLTLPVTHTYMMQNPRVIAEVQLFLETGRFEPGLSMCQAMRQILRRD